MDKKELLLWLEEQINSASADCTESSGLAPNSFGAGYDVGYHAALCAVRDLLDEGDNG